MAGCKRDISGGREFSYVSATEYSMQVFDRVNDSRFWKSFITKYGSNYTDGAPYWITTKKNKETGKLEITDDIYKAHPEYYPDDVKVILNQILVSIVSREVRLVSSISSIILVTLVSLLH